MTEANPDNEAMWRMLLVDGYEPMNSTRHILRLLPSNPRCKFCYSPFEGFGSGIARVIYKKTRSRLNPNMCNVCEQAATAHPGGAEIELSLLFADVRGSTTLAERISPSEFSRLMSRFYSIGVQVLAETDALLEKFVGDEVVGLFVPGMAGKDHAAKALHAARHLMQLTGHGSGKEPWLPIGVGIHTGVAFVGAVGGEQGVADITALGDAVNVTARLASRAGPGEILASEAACRAAGLPTAGLEQRDLSLKGRSEPVSVRVLTGNFQPRG